jgi:hypothetical protein
MLDMIAVFGIVAPLHRQLYGTPPLPAGLLPREAHLLPLPLYILITQVLAQGLPLER